MSAVDLSIIIPAFHESRRIGKTLDQLAAHLEQARLGRVEVIVIAAASTDGTAAIAAAKRSRFTDLKIMEPAKRAGKGRDVRCAILEAKGRYRLFMDADLATPLHHIDTVFEHLTGGTQIIIGVRDLKQTHSGLRKLISISFNYLARGWLGLSVRDTQCGFKAFQADIAQDLFSRQRLNGWLFDMEILAIAKQRGYRVEELKLPDWQDIPGGTFGAANLKDSLLSIGELIAIKWNLLRKAYDQD